MHTSQDTTTAEEAAYLTAHGWFEAMPVQHVNIVIMRLWRDPIASAHHDMPTERALTIQRARDAAEKRAVWSSCFDGALTMLMAFDAREGRDAFARRDLLTSQAAAVANRKLFQYAEHFDVARRESTGSAPAATVPPPPPPCTGAGIIPPRYCGVTSASSTAFDPAPCGVCGQVIEVDGFMRTVTHAYRLPEVKEVALTSEHNAVLVTVGPATARMSLDAARRLKSAIDYVIGDAQLAHAAGRGA